MSHSNASGLRVALAILLTLSGPLSVPGTAQEMEHGTDLGGVGSPASLQDAGLQELANWMTGSFSSAEQARKDTAFLDIRLEMWPIWTGRDDGVWLYVEQAEAEALDAPYRQRVYHLSTTADGRYRSAIFTLPGDPLAYAGAWREDEPLASLSPEDLTPREGCDVVLRRIPSGVFEGATEPGACPSTLRGAAFATTRVTIEPDRFVSWDRGFDAGGSQVWGARAGGYIFLKKSR